MPYKGKPRAVGGRRPNLDETKIQGLNSGVGGFVWLPGAQVGRSEGISPSPSFRLTTTAFPRGRDLPLFTTNTGGLLTAIQLPSQLALAASYYGHFTFY
jgi:hypothetical protein